MSVGGSAARRAQEARRHERELREQWREAREQARRWEAADEGERRVAAQLLVLTARGWRLLVDRRWPGTRSGNVDMILVGPGGVFVVDVKNWRAAPEALDGRLRADGVSRDGEIGKLLAVTRIAERSVESLGLSPVAVQPLMVFVGRKLDQRLGRVRLLGEYEAGPALVAERRRIGAAAVRAVADHLERAFPAYESPTVPAPRAAARPQPPTAPATGGPDTAMPMPAVDALFDVEGLRDAAMEAALRAPIERWMTFLHPDQVGLVRRNWSGPARISGPAGTGKTVVGLHRAAHLAQRTTGRILFVTFANNLPRVQATFLRTMSPEVCDRVDFRSLHAWAQDYLHERGVPVHLNGDKAEDAFSRAWLRVGRSGVLAEIDPSPQYWRDEIDYVIKGRGITTLPEYVGLARRRRVTTLRRPHREAMWELFTEYERIRVERGVHDFNDLLSLALAESSRAPGPAYAAVIADEVQDLTLVGVRLLHSLVGDAPNGLLLVGDGQQAVYPGGFRLGDAGIDIRGDRGQVLRTNYRNAKQILEAALQVVADESFEDIDGTRNSGQRDVELTYHDGAVVRVAGPNLGQHDQALVEALRRQAETAASGDDPGQGPAWAELAVLCPSWRLITHYQRLLAQAGIPVCLLDHYDGQPTDAVKLGSYRRAKGLEFKHVYLPQHSNALAAADPGDAALERRTLARSQLFVAMTRARDTLWLGSVTN